MVKRIYKIVKMDAKIKVVTGLRIGGEKETYEIGGLDNPIIRTFHLSDSNKKIPFIPGSSLKGRLRSLLELKYGAYADDGKPSNTGLLKNINDEERKQKVSLILKLFGVGAKDKKEDNEDIGPTRLIFEDFYPTEDTLKRWERLEKEEKTDRFGTEIKPENLINRITGAAEHPRKTERIIPGSEFEGSIKLILYEDENGKDDMKEMIELLKEGKKLLNETYLGGNGSRGYGKVIFDFKYPEDETSDKNEE